MDYLEYKLDKKLSFVSSKLISAFAPWLIKAVKIEGASFLWTIFEEVIHLYDASNLTWFWIECKWYSINFMTFSFPTSYNILILCYRACLTCFNKYFNYYCCIELKHQETTKKSKYVREEYILCHYLSLFATLSFIQQYLVLYMELQFEW